MVHARFYTRDFWMLRVDQSPALEDEGMAEDDTNRMQIHDLNMFQETDTLV